MTITDLPDVTHSVTLTALIPAGQDPPNSSMVVFESAVLTSSPEPLKCVEFDFRCFIMALTFIYLIFARQFLHNSVSFSSQTIDDNDIAFLGRWSFDTAPTGASFHSTQTLGDRAVASFNGTSSKFQLAHRHPVNSRL